MSPDPRITATLVYSALAGHHADHGAPGMRAIVVPGPPQVKRRPRFVNGRVISDPANAAAQQATAAHLSDRTTPMASGRVVLVCVFFMPTARRVDVDNLIKHVMDAGTGVLYDDDHQVHRTAGIIVHGDPDPRTLVLTGPLHAGGTR